MKYMKKFPKIKDIYLNTINQIKNSMNFFDDSLDIIKIAKEENNGKKRKNTFFC